MVKAEQAVPVGQDGVSGMPVTTIVRATVSLEFGGGFSPKGGVVGETGTFGMVGVVTQLCLPLPPVPQAITAKVKPTSISTTIKRLNNFSQ